MTDEKKPPQGAGSKALKRPALASRRQLEIARLAAGAAREDGAFDAQAAEGGVGLVPGSRQQGTAAMVTHMPRRVAALKLGALACKFPKPFLLLLVLRLKRGVLGLQIGALALKFRLLGLDESKVLTEHRRRAMFVDQAFDGIQKAIEEAHFQ